MTAPLDTREIIAIYNGTAFIFPDTGTNVTAPPAGMWVLVASAVYPGTVSLTLNRSGSSEWPEFGRLRGNTAQSLTRVVSIEEKMKIGVNSDVCPDQKGAILRIALIPLTT